MSFLNYQIFFPGFKFMEDVGLPFIQLKQIVPAIKTSRKCSCKWSVFVSVHQRRDRV